MNLGAVILFFLSLFVFSRKGRKGRKVFVQLCGCCFVLSFNSDGWQKGSATASPKGFALYNRFAIRLSLTLFLYAAFAAGSGVKPQLNKTQGAKI